MSPLFFCCSAHEIEPDFQETARYLGYGKTQEIPAEIKTKISDAIAELQKIIIPQAVYAEFDLFLDGSFISFSDLKINSKYLKLNLKNCSKIIIFAATIGPQVDARIRRAQINSTADAAIFQATGAMFIEAFVEKLNEKLKSEYEKKGFRTHPRYSPGYGDVPLTIQKDFFRLLPAKRIGLTLMESLIMAPEKSVTAFIGLEADSTQES